MKTKEWTEKYTTSTEHIKGVIAKNIYLKEVIEHQRKQLDDDRNTQHYLYAQLGNYGWRPTK